VLLRSYIIHIKVRPVYRPLSPVNMRFALLATVPSMLAAVVTGGALKMPRQDATRQASMDARIPVADVACDKDGAPIGAIPQPPNMAPSEEVKM